MTARTSALPSHPARTSWSESLWGDGMLAATRQAAVEEGCRPAARRILSQSGGLSLPGGGVSSVSRSAQPSGSSCSCTSTLRASNSYDQTAGSACSRQRARSGNAWPSSWKWRRRTYSRPGSSGNRCDRGGTRSSLSDGGRSPHRELPHSSIWRQPWGWPAAHVRTGAFRVSPANAPAMAWLELEDGSWTISPSIPARLATLRSALLDPGPSGFAFGSAIGLNVTTVRPQGISSRRACHLVRLCPFPPCDGHVDPGGNHIAVAVDSPFPLIRFRSCCS